MSCAVATRLVLATALLALASTVRAQADTWEDAPAQAPRDGYDVQVDVEAANPVTLDSFQSGLSPYGDWVQSGAYGTVWRPRVAPGWRPYYYGRWEWTNEGWFWVSEEPFGWATYHYGRWAWEGASWVWVPGYQWAPAWVSWRYGGDAVGWAPLAPGLSLYVTSYAFFDFWWTFVPSYRFCGTPVWGVAYAPSRAWHYYGVTSPAPPRPRPPALSTAPGGTGRGRPPPPGSATPGWGGPPPRFIEERTGRPVQAARIVAEPHPGAARARPGEVGVYRPGQTPSQGYPAQGGASRAAPAVRPMAPSHPLPPGGRSPVPGGQGARPSYAQPPPPTSRPPSGPPRTGMERGGAPASRPRGTSAPPPSAPRGGLAPSGSPAPRGGGSAPSGGGRGGGGGAHHAAGGGGHHR